jgi:tRNA1Val (adenine37-N6)-methyltransferase
MANDYFRFKEFTIQQDRTAMKVGTDGILLGAWVGVKGVRKTLDVGTGTGLIALMLAQRGVHELDAIEIDESAARQAMENVAASPWTSRVTVNHVSLQEFALRTHSRYDLIVSNPPFYEHAYPTKSQGRAFARHGEGLPYADLLECSSALLDS